MRKLFTLPGKSYQIRKGLKITVLAMLLIAMAFVCQTLLWPSNPSMNSKKIKSTDLSEIEKNLSLGVGYDSISHSVKKKCIRRKNPYSLKNMDKAQRSVMMIRGYQDLEAALGLGPMSIFSSGKSKLFELRSHFLSSQKIHGFHHFVLLSQRVMNTTSFLDSGFLKEKYQDYLKHNGAKNFWKRCGDSFLSRYSTGQETFLLLEFRSLSDEEYQTLETFLDSYTGNYRTKAEFQKATTGLLKFELEKASLLNGHEQVRELIRPNKFQMKHWLDEFLHPSNWGEPDIHSFEFRPYPTLNKEQEHFNEQINTTLEKLRKFKKVYYETLEYHANLEFIKFNQKQFPSSNPTVIDEIDDKVMTVLANIRRKVSHSQPDHQACSLADPDPHIRTKLPDRNRYGMLNKDIRLCENPVYRSGTGPSCGVEAYRKKRSSFCGVELYKEASNKLCPGYVPPKGPKILLKVPEEVDLSQALSSHDKDLLSRECIQNFGPDWIFSSVTNEQNHPVETNEKDHKLPMVNCIRLAVIGSCRHPSHGVERFRECSHENHGVLAYRECRSPEFGVDFIRPMACETQSGLQVSSDMSVTDP